MSSVVSLRNKYTLEHRTVLLKDIAEAQFEYLRLAKEAADCPWWRPGKRTFLIQEASKIMSNIKKAIALYNSQYKQPLIVMARITTG